MKSFPMILTIVALASVFAAAQEDRSVVPKFTGNRLCDVKEYIAERDNMVLGEIQGEYDYDRPENQVKGQTPPADTPIAPGETVTINLTISKGPRPILWAVFVTSNRYGVAPFRVVFTNCSTAHAYTVKGWLWKFGDGTESTEERPEHVYTAPGEYDVSLTIYTDQEVSDTLTKEKEVIVLPSTSGVLGPMGGQVATPKGSAFSVAAGMLLGEVKIDVCDTTEASIRQNLPENVPYAGAITVFADFTGVVWSKEYVGVMTIPLLQPLPPGTLLDVYRRGWTYGQWIWMDEKAHVDAGGATATLKIRGTGTYLVRVPDEFSVAKIR